MSASLTIRGARILDGTGSPAVTADLVVEGGRILDVIEPPARGPDGGGRTVVEADGATLCPGFIDIHSHGDLIHVLPAERQRELMRGRLAQGITTEIVGNCGLGVFPVAPRADRAALQRSVVQWMTPAEASDWPAGRWSDLAGYLDALEASGTWSNVGALQPHGPLRMSVSGIAPGEPGPGARAAMERSLAAALDAGAFGLSTGLIYPPGIFTPTDELIRLARIVSARTGGSGFVASHIRGSSETLVPAVEELLEIARASGVRVQHSHNEAVGPDHWRTIDRVLSAEEAAARAGAGVAFDVFPYTGAATMMLAIYPPWALEGGVPALLSRLASPAIRRRIGEAIETVVPSWPPWTEGGWPHNLVRACGWERITIGSVSSAANRDLEGLNLAELGRRRGRAPFEAISDLMLEEEGWVSQIVHGISGEEGNEAGLEAILAHPLGAICTDANDFGRGRPHPAAWGAFPRVLGEYSRRRGVLGLAEAVRKMTGYPASLLGLKDRGIVRAGAMADLVLFDPATVGSDAGWDRPRLAASGILRVWVNGVEVAGSDHRPGPSEPAPPGQVLRRG